MPYVQRDASGRIVGVFAQPDGGVQEHLEPNSAELRTFMLGHEDNPMDARLQLADSDQTMVRVLEDLIETLIGKGLIAFTDLPDAAQAKLIERRTLRRSVNALNLLSNDDNGTI